MNLLGPFVGDKGGVYWINTDNGGRIYTAPGTVPQEAIDAIVSNFCKCLLKVDPTDRLRIINEEAAK